MSVIRRFTSIRRRHVHTAPSQLWSDSDGSVLERAGYRCEIRLPSCQLTATRVYVEPAHGGRIAMLRLPQQAACGRCWRTLTQLAADLAS